MKIAEKILYFGAWILACLSYILCQNGIIPMNGCYYIIGVLLPLGMIYISGLFASNN